MRAYARQAKNKQLEVDAAEIRIRSERRLGEMLAQQKETVGLATGGEHGGRTKVDGSRAEPSNARPTLADAGIDKKLSSRAQKLAAVPEGEFEADLAEWRERVAAEGKNDTEIERQTGVSRRTANRWIDEKRAKFQSGKTPSSDKPAGRSGKQRSAEERAALAEEARRREAKADIFNGKPPEDDWERKAVEQHKAEAEARMAHYALVKARTPVPSIRPRPYARLGSRMAGRRGYGRDRAVLSPMLALASATAMGRFRAGLRRLFYGHRPAAVAFQAGLLALDLAALAYFLATTFVADALWLRAVDLLLGTLLALEFLGRLAAHRHPMHYLDNAAALVDVVVILSLFLSALGGNLAFLRVLRTVRLLRSYNVLGRLKKLFPTVRRNEEVIAAALNFAVFILMASALVYVTQRSVNPKIQDFVDALYFTVATLSTTGFGDVTLIGSTGGELLSVAMMIVGISLFLRLAQAVFRPGGKVRHPCPQCGLQRHDPDAVHCKACGQVLNIPDDED